MSGREAGSLRKEQHKDHGAPGGHHAGCVCGGRGLGVGGEVFLQLKEGDKAIVFSEWEDMLKIISHALEHNDIPYQRCEASPISPPSALH
eukprot:755100-Hanusia_phi.AAC.1